MRKYSSKGFTLIELLIVIAIIGILAAIAIPQFNQYKIRGYDTSAKQGLRDVALLCNAYWIDNDCSEECSLPKIMAAAYGFNQNSDLDVTLPSTSSQCSNFCASAKSNSSPNTYSIDSAALISSGGTCGGAGGSVQTASTTAPPPTPLGSFATYNATKATEECNSVYEGTRTRDEMRAYGTFAVVDRDGNLADKAGDPKGAEAAWYKSENKGNENMWVAGCDTVADGWQSFNVRQGIRDMVERGSHKLVLIASGGSVVWNSCANIVCEDDRDAGEWRASEWWGAANQAKRKNMKYNFETGTWSNDQGGKFKNGKLVE